jgi:hypothetical protein
MTTTVNQEPRVSRTQGHIDDYPEGPVIDRSEEPEVDAGELVTRTEDLPDPVRREIIAQREAGTTLSELKANFPQVAGEVIREVLPPANARERQAREKKAKNQPKPSQGEDEAKKDEPKPEPAPKRPRYVEDAEVLDQLAAQTVELRKVIGRDRLAELLGVSGSAVWRHEHRKTHPDEVEPLRDGLVRLAARVEAGEFARPAATTRPRQLTRADLAHRFEELAKVLHAARGQKTITKTDLIDTLLAIIEPQPQEDPPAES